MNRVLISGANGFLGSHLVSAFRERGASVIGLGSSATSINDEIEYHCIDLRHSIEKREIFAGADLAIHAAAILPGQDQDLSLNETITQNFVNGVASGEAHLVHISSASVYGSRSGERSETDKLSPDSDYGWSKLSSERIVDRAVSAGDLAHACVIRPANIFGPGMTKTNNLRRMGDAISRGRFVGVGSGDNVKSLLHIEDAVSACILASNIRDDLTALNVSSGHLMMREIASRIAVALEVGPPRWLSRIEPSVISSVLSKVPLESVSAVGRSIRTFGSSDVLNDGKIRTLGFDPQFDLSERLDQCFRVDRQRTQGTEPAQKALPSQPDS